MLQPVARRIAVVAVQAALAAAGILAIMLPGGFSGRSS
jgi:hypothetical protein